MGEGRRVIRALPAPSIGLATTQSGRLLSGQDEGPVLPPYFLSFSGEEGHFYFYVKISRFLKFGNQLKNVLKYYTCQTEQIFRLHPVYNVWLRQVWFP